MIEQEKLQLEASLARISTQLKPELSGDAHQKNQKRIGNLEKKLRDKELELDGALKSLVIINEKYSRLEKDRQRLFKLKKPKHLSNPKVDELKVEELKVEELKTKIETLTLQLSKSLEQRKEKDLGIDKIKNELILTLKSKTELEKKLERLEEEVLKLRMKSRKYMEKLRKVEMDKDLEVGKSDSKSMELVEVKKSMEIVEVKEMEMDKNEMSRLIGENKRLKCDIETCEIRLAKLCKDNSVGNPIWSQMAEENEKLKSLMKVKETEIKSMQIELEDLQFNYKELMKSAVLSNY